MKKKLIFQLVAVTIAFAIATIGWFLLKPENRQLTSDPISKEAKGTLDETPEMTQGPKTAAPAVPTPEARVAERTRQTLNTFFEETEQDEDPYVQELMRAMEAPAYEEYMKKQLATPGFSFKLYFDYLESQGVESHRDMYENSFRRHYPTGSLASYEPMMRKRLAELFQKAPAIDPTDSEAVLEQISAVMSEFGKAPGHSSWVLAHFLGVGEHDWAADIQKNAASILAETTESRDTRDPARFTDVEPSAAVSETIQTKEKVDIPPENEHLRETLPSRADIEPRPETAEALEAEFLKNLFADIPEAPSDTAFQQTLRERFSPERFNTMMQTLKRYGREEGLRRLKVSDPEIATHLQRLMSSKKETD